MSNWKIKNISNKDVKITIAISGVGAPGVLLKPGQFCIGLAQKTGVLDAQMRRGLISIEEFDNSFYMLELAKAYNETILDSAIEKTKAFTKK